MTAQNQAQNNEQRKSKAVDICPRCGLPVSWYETLRRGNRVYMLAVHYLGYVRGKGKLVRKCYLGPVESYEYASRLHRKENLEIYGLTNPDRIFEYLNVLLAVLPDEARKKLEMDPSSKPVIESLVAKLINAARSLDEILRE